MGQIALRIAVVLLVLQAFPALSQHLSVSLAEMRCVGFIRENELPMDLYIAGTEQEGTTTFVTEGGLIYVDGPGVRSVRIGDIFSVVRAEGRVRDQLGTDIVGTYYKDLGTVRIESVRPEGATGTVTSACTLMVKGDQLIPVVRKSAISFKGELADRNAPFPREGLASSILVGKDDAREMATGYFCFIGVGRREGVKVGDRFTIYRPQPHFNPQDLSVNASHSMTTYENLQTSERQDKLIDMLLDRRLPPRVLGDLMVIDVGETTSACKIIHSRFEVHLGDLVVRR